MAQGARLKARPAEGSSWLKAQGSRLKAGERAFSLRRSSAASGQSLAEYSLVLALVAAAMMGMQVYAKRGIQAALKTASDDLSPCRVHACFGAVGDPDGELGQLIGEVQEGGLTEEERLREPALRQGLVLDRLSLDRLSRVTTVTDQSVLDEELPGGGRTRTVERERVSSRGALGDGVSSVSSVVVDANPQ